jgi:copper(I)-binding protein
MQYLDQTGQRRLSAVLLTLALSLACTVAAAQPSAAIDNARIRLLPGTLPLAGYFTLHNTGKQNLRLVGASSPDFMRVMMHHSIEQNGMHKMIMVKHLDIAPGKSLRFAPGGYHLMMMHRKRQLKVGDHVPVVLQFADQSTMTVDFTVHSAETQ